MTGSLGSVVCLYGDRLRALLPSYIDPNRRHPTMAATENVKTMSFAVSLTTSVLQGMNEPEISSTMKSILQIDDRVVVGTIVLLRSSAMIWMGWGEKSQEQNHDGNSLGQGVPAMGPLVAAVPGKKYSGAFSDSSVSSSTLVGGESEDQLLSSQMAARLSQKLGYPIMVSCTLNTGETPEWMQGNDRISSTQRAAALAEKHVRGILTHQLAETKR